MSALARLGEPLGPAIHVIDFLEVADVSRMARVTKWWYAVVDEASKVLSAVAVYDRLRRRTVEIWCGNLHMFLLYKQIPTLLRGGVTLDQLLQNYALMRLWTFSANPFFPIVFYAPSSARYFSGPIDLPGIHAILLYDLKNRQRLVCGERSFEVAHLQEALWDAVIYSGTPCTSAGGITTESLVFSHPELTVRQALVPAACLGHVAFVQQILASPEAEQIPLDGEDSIWGAFRAATRNGCARVLQELIAFPRLRESNYFNERPWGVTWDVSYELM